MYIINIFKSIFFVLEIMAASLPHLPINANYLKFCIFRFVMSRLLQMLTDEVINTGSAI